MLQLSTLRYPNTLSTTGTTAKSVSTTATPSTSTTTTSTTSLTNSQAQSILKQAPFAPTDINLFRQGTYPNAVAYQPAAAPAKPLTTTQLKDFAGTKMYQLYKAMNPSISSATAALQAQSAANLISDPKLTKAIPDARLRTAAAMLKGTAANGAIAALQSGHFKVQFGALDPATMAQSQPMSDGTQSITVNSRYQNEDPRELASLLAHETSHQDGTNSLPEEQAAYSLESMVYGQYVLADSSLPLQQTELTQRRNQLLMARMNDRDATTGNLRILTANGTNLYPNGATTLPNFASAVTVENPAGVQATSAGNAYLRSYVKNLTGKDLGASVNYDSNTLNAIDSSQTLFSLQQLIQIDKNLKLNVPTS